jgi:hypothetical protein
MGESIPAVTGDYLIELLKFDGWEDCGKSTHGVTLKKFIDGHYVVTTIPTKKGSMPDGTLGAILSVKQTCLGKTGLTDLIKRFKEKN